MNGARHIEAAAGYADCDLNIVNARVADLYRGVLVEGATVSISGGAVVGVNDGLRARETFDAGGRVLAPGFTDAHVHIESSLLSPAEYARLVCPRGTTSVVADPHEIANVLGYDGMSYMLRASEGLPVDVFLVAPSCVPATDFDTAGAAIYAADMHPWLRDPRVLGLGEVMNFPGVLARDRILLDKVALFREAGKAIDGHAPGLSGKDLSAYIAAGILSDHESTTAEEALEKVSKGMRVMLREGSAARDLENLASAVTARNARRFMLCSDDRHPDDLLREGHVDRMLRLLVAKGVDPLDALAMASLVPAEHYGLRDRGAIAPGKRADLVLLEDLSSFKVAAVWKDGRLVSRDGRMAATIEPRPVAVRDSVNIKWIEAEDFRIRVEGRRVRALVCAEGSLVTGELVVEPPVGPDGYCASDAGRDLARVYVIERHRGSGNIGSGYLHGLGMKRGAIGSTVSHDSHNMIVAGMDDESIFKAAKHLNKIGGGFVATLGDEVLAELPLPIGGLMSDRAAEDVVAALDRFSALFAAEGFANSEPLMTLAFMALPVIPKLKITDRGLVDVERFERVGLWVD
ncbi:MAG: adenine deaminase [Spirochaetales bacterium]|nr:adenine deaminase [Spirochaetales bacterium]